MAGTTMDGMHADKETYGKQRVIDVVLAVQFLHFFRELEASTLQELKAWRLLSRFTRGINLVFFAQETSLT